MAFFRLVPRIWTVRQVSLNGELERTIQSQLLDIDIPNSPIAPGKTFTYRFRAELYGTSWWHGHYSAQYVNGLSGPIVIHGPSSDNNYDIDVGPVMLSDWFHDYYDNLVIDIFYATETCDPHCPPMSNNMVSWDECY